MVYRKIHALLVLILTVNIAVGDEPCGKPADIAFVIDSSSSIWGPHFDIQIQFVQELVKRFDIGPNTTHVAALTFSDKVATEFYFNEVTDVEQADEMVSKIKHKNGKATFTHDALEAMRLDLFSPSNGARSTVPKIGILLTDGKSTYGDKTQLQARLAKESGIKILAIGIGFGVNDEELSAVVTPPAENNYFHKSSFDDLNSVMFQELIGQTACKVIETTSFEQTTIQEESAVTTKTSTTKPPPVYITPEMSKDQTEKACQGKEADIVFIVDMSSSIQDEDFEEQLRFLSDFVRNFDIDSGKTRVGMLTFSDTAKAQFYLDDYKTREDVSNVILKVKSEGGRTNTHLALQKLQEELLTGQHGFRPGVAHICILITDGISSKPELTVPQAKLVHKAGVYVFAIGVGSMTDASELRMMASNPEYAFEVNGYKALKQIKTILAYKTCEVPQGDQPQSQGCTLDKAEVIFGLYGLGGIDRQNVGEFVKGMGNAFDLQSGNVRIGLIEDCVRSSLKLERYQQVGDFSSAVSDAMNTELSQLLFQVRRGFGYTRKETEKIAILVIYGNIQDMDNAHKQAKYLKFKGKVIVVGVGEDIDTEQLKMLASYRNNFEPDISHVFPVSSSADLPFIVKKLHKLMCN